MTTKRPTNEIPPTDYDEPVERVDYGFGFSRRAFVQVLGTGLLIVASHGTAVAQRGGGVARNIAARILIGKDGRITVMAGKVEGGQGARGELAQAAAEELRVPVSQIQMVPQRWPARQGG